MKRLMMIIAMLGLLLTAGLAIAEDITVSITIPEEYVSRLTAMINVRYMQGQACEGLTMKECFVLQMIKKPIKRELYMYELGKTRSEAIATAGVGVSQIEVIGE